MRDRLIELFKKIEKEPAITCPAYKTDETCKDCKYSINDSLCNHIERQVDYLLANGIVALSVNIGETVYYIFCNSSILELKVASIEIALIETFRIVFRCYGGVGFYERDIGTTVFLTKEEAERALKGGE